MADTRVQNNLLVPFPQTRGAWPTARGSAKAPSARIPEQSECPDVSDLWGLRISVDPSIYVLPNRSSISPTQHPPDSQLFCLKRIRQLSSVLGTKLFYIVLSMNMVRFPRKFTIKWGF